MHRACGSSHARPGSGAGPERALSWEVASLQVMKLSELGEFGLIRRLAPLLGEPGDGEVWVGDDTAVLRAPAGTILFTADILVEGVHFDLALTGPEDLGWKAIAVNASDVAAMGGIPRRAVVSLGLPPTVEVEWLECLYGGMREFCNAFGMAVVGGDISRCPTLVISVALLGNPAGRLVVSRGGARVGDAICVTGVLGASAAGLELLRTGNGTAGLELVRTHLRPTPRVREAEVLRRHLPTAMIDVSDGFAADLSHLCDASGVGVVVDAGRLPVFDAAGVDLRTPPLDLALGGGEDYELCFTIPAGRAAVAAAAVTEVTGTPVTVVGEVVEADRGRRLVRDGVEEDIGAAGWDHLRA
jgi:thiamine-monophosphate kinase